MDKKRLEKLRANYEVARAYREKMDDLMHDIHDIVWKWLANCPSTTNLDIAEVAVKIVADSDSATYCPPNVSCKAISVVSGACKTCWMDYLDNKLGS